MAGIKLKASGESINLTHKGGTIIQGADGGYYTPSVDAAGNLSWAPNKAGMEVPGVVNIKGPQGEPGRNGRDGKDGVDGIDGDDSIYVGSGEPTDEHLIWINPDGEVDIKVVGDGGIHVGDDEPAEEDLIWINPEEVDTEELATKDYVDKAIAQVQVNGGGSGGSVNLANYYTKTEVDNKIEQIELTPGPAGKDGVDGAPGKDGQDGKDYVLTEADKQEIAGMVEVSGDGTDLTGYYTKTETDNKIADAVGAIEHPTTDLSDYAKKSEIPSLDGYAKTTDIPDVSGFTTMSAVEGKGYQTEAQVNALIEIALGVIENGTY